MRKLLLFAAAVVPGLLLAAIYCGYIVTLGMVRPEMVPAVPQDERDAMGAAAERLADRVKTVDEGHGGAAWTPGGPNQTVMRSFSLVSSALLTRPGMQTGLPFMAAA